MNLSSEETLRARRLHALLEDKNGGHRHVLVATDGIVKAVEELAETSPSGPRPISVVADACALSLRLAYRSPSRQSFCWTAWNSKSFLAARLAASRSPATRHYTREQRAFSEFLGGLASSWKAAAAGRIAKI